MVIGWLLRAGIGACCLLWAQGQPGKDEQRGQASSTSLSTTRPPTVKGRGLGTASTETHSTNDDAVEAVAARSQSRRVLYDPPPQSGSKHARHSSKVPSLASAIGNAEGGGEAGAAAAVNSPSRGVSSAARTNSGTSIGTVAADLYVPPKAGGQGQVIRSGHPTGVPQQSQRGQGTSYVDPRKSLLRGTSSAGQVSSHLSGHVVKDLNAPLKTNDQGQVMKQAETTGVKQKAQRQQELLRYVDPRKKRTVGHEKKYATIAGLIQDSVGTHVPIPDQKIANNQQVVGSSFPCAGSWWREDATYSAHELEAAVWRCAE